ncbi:MAG: hypothetical protein WAQ27_00310 [Candidatus Microsaccharimonas sp.]
MAKSFFTKRTYLATGIFVVALSFLGVFIQAPTASAGPCPSNRYWCNSDEQRAYYACFDASNGGRVVQGAIWFNNSGGTATDDGYYALGVNIGATDTSVAVNIRGSVYACGQGANDWSYAYGVNVRPDTDGGSVPESWRLSIPGTVINRGQYQGANYTWTSMGSSLAATLNVSGLATNNEAGSDTQTIVVGLYRCYSSNGVWATGSCNIAHVPINITRARLPRFTLVPTVTVNPSSSVEVGQNVVATPTITSTGGGTAVNANWQLTRFIVPRTGTYPTTQTANATDPLVHYGNGAVSVGTGTQNFPTGVTNLAAATRTTEDLPVGTKICFALSVKPYTNNDTLGYWSHGQPACVVVSKKPKVQVLGGDLIVGRATAYNVAATSRVSTSTSFSVASNRSYGSWAEYGIIPSGIVTGMGSAASFSGGAATTNPTADLCSLSILTFSNRQLGSCHPANIGKYVDTTTAPNIASRFQVDDHIAGNSTDIRTLTSGKTYSIDNATLNITSTAPIADDGAGKGKWVVINDPDATVTITTNINYTPGALTQIDDIPQVVIIAKNIIIAESVTNVDAWLIAAGKAPADGYINTCGTVTAGSPTSATLNDNYCRNKLTINGPILANKLYMYRTAGSEPGTMGNPAEVFNLRADAYVWASVYSPGNGRIPTVNTKELPPRF